jgi:hypothetical protein
MKTNKFFLGALALTIGISAIVSCGSDDAASLPPIGGFNSADEVAATDLVAYWPLNGTGVESKSNTAPSNAVGVTWVAGAKGQAANFNQGYLKYPSIASMAATLPNFSVTAWIKLKNNGSTGSVIFSLARPNEWAGNINFMAETGWKAATVDSLTVKGLIVSNSNLGWQDSRNTVKLDQGQIDFNLDPANASATKHAAFPNKVADTWAHSVLTWNSTTRMFLVYINGVKVSNPAWELRGAPTSEAFTFTTPTTPMIGAFGDVATTTETWNKPLTGLLDEIRVYKKSLTPAEIGALYELEKAGR